MTLQDFINFTTDSLNNFSNSFTNLLPNFVASITIFLIGLITAALLMKVWFEITKAISLEKSLSVIDAYASMTKANKSYSLTKLVSVFLWWSTVLVFTIAALKSLGIKEIDSVFALFFGYLPNIIVGTLALVVGLVFAILTSSVIGMIGELIKLPLTETIAKIASLAIVIFAARLSLVAFGVDSEMLKLIAQVFIIAIGIALALGSKDIASDQLKKIKKHFS